MGFAENFSPLVLLIISPDARSIITSWFSQIESYASLHSRIGRPILNEFL
jgi:hypothetical protein